MNKRNKTFRPRTGIKFGGRNEPNSIVGSFGSAILDSAVLSGSVDVYVEKLDGTIVGADGTGIRVSSSLDIEGSISFGRSRARGMNREQLGGIAKPYSGIGSGSTVLATPVTSSAPSWTRGYLGIPNQSSILTVLSSSDHEVFSLNLFRSGTESVEKSAVPVSQSLYYSKQTKLSRIIVKHTASFFDTAAATGSIPVTGSYPTLFAAGTGVLCSLVTAHGLPSQVNSSNNPATIKINVPVSGRLVDIRVWVDLLHLSGGAGRYKPLGVTAVALRNPNLSWGNAHPLYNDNNFVTQVGLNTAPCPLPNFYKHSFLLWEGGGQGPFGHPYFPGAGGDLKGGLAEVGYPTFECDRSMRTIFSDGAGILNPRHLKTGVSPSGNFDGAPNSDPSIGGNFAYGLNVPWTSDAGGLAVTDPTTYVGPGSPPSGWLTGPGGSNAVNEWPTSGTNYGATEIRPVYPLLDSLYIKKVIGTEKGYDGSSSPDAPPPTPDVWRGFRLGLRGTEISGTWELLLVSNYRLGAQTDSPDLYFRQARLEITYESAPSTAPVPVRPRSRKTALSNQEYLLWQISGSDTGNWGTSVGTGLDYFITQIFSVVDSESQVNRTFGLSLGTGSTGQTAALVWSLTGVLETYSGSAPPWLINNQYGVPAIPASSWSLAARDPVDAIPANNPFQDIFPGKLLDGARELPIVARDNNPPKTLDRLAAELLTGSDS